MEYQFKRGDFVFNAVTKERATFVTYLPKNCVLVHVATPAQPERVWSATSVRPIDAPPPHINARCVMSPTEAIRMAEDLEREAAIVRKAKFKGSLVPGSWDEIAINTGWRSPNDKI